MKKTYEGLGIVLLTLIVLISFCACGSRDNEEEQANKTSISLPRNGKKGPSQETIMQDINNVLMEENPHIQSIDSVDTIKSLTEDSSYYLNATVKAKSMYADWQYEVSLTYREYDQGWMINNAYAGNEIYSLTRCPTDEEMTQIANNDRYLLENWNRYLPFENGSIQGEMNSSDGFLTFCLPVWSS